MKYSTVEEIQKKLVLISEVPERAKTLEDYEISELLNYIDNTIEDSLVYGLPHTLFYRGGEQCFELDQVYGGDLERFESDGYKYVRGIILEAKGSVEPDVQNNTPTIENFKELNTPEAKVIFNKAIEAGLMFQDGPGYKWSKEKTKQLLAYFAERLSLYLELNKGKLDKDGKQTVSWKPFERLFKVNRLQSARSSWLKNNYKFQPTGYELVDELF